VFHLKRVVIGLLPFLVLASPFWAGLTAFYLARLSGASDPMVWGRHIGLGLFLGFLIFLPVYMLGKALQVSLQKPETPKPQVQPAALQPITSLLTTAEVIDVWKTAVDVQQHFNDLELRIRNFAVTLLVAVVGATAFALKERYTVSIEGTTFSLGVAVLCAGIIGWLAFYFMDMHWYHRLLIGAVKQTLSIEAQRETSAPELGLSRAIGKESPWPLWGTFHIHSSEKITLFYAAGLAIMVILTVMLMVATPTAGNPPNPVSKLPKQAAQPVVVPSASQSQPAQTNRIDNSRRIPRDSTTASTGRQQRAEQNHDE
jgi:hypothetical protein